MKFATRIIARVAMAGALALAATPALAVPTWHVQSDYRGQRDSTSQSRSLRGLALTPDDASLYGGFIQGTSSAAIRKVQSADIGPTITLGSGSIQAVTGAINQPKGVATDDRGNVYTTLNPFGASTSLQFRIYNSTLSSVIANATSTYASSQLSGIAVQKLGANYYVYLARNGGQATVERWDVTNAASPTLDVTWGIGGRADLKVLAGANAYCNGLEVDTDGIVYIAGGLQTTTRGDAVFRLAANGLTLLNTNQSVPGAMDVAIFHERVYVTQYLSTTSTIAVLTKSTLAQETTFNTGIAHPYNLDTDNGYSGIDVSALGQLFVNDQIYAQSASPNRAIFDRILTATLDPDPTTTNLGTSPNPSTCGEKVTLTATVSPNTATGSVEFFDGAGSLGTAPLVNGIATLSYNFASYGKHVLTAVYGGEPTYSGSTSAPVSQIVDPIASSTSLTSDVNPSFVNGKVNLSATVTPNDATGTVEFFDGATSLGTAPVAGGIATLSVNFGTAGKHVLTATYGGDACHPGSSSAPYSQTVDLNTTTTSLTSDVNPSDCGSKVNLTATVSPNAATGTVEFFDGATSLGTAPVTAGVATLSISSLTVGKHMLTATYSGDGVYAASTSNTYSQTVNAIATSTSLTSDVNPSLVGGKVNLTATVTPNDATGTVEFFDGATSLGTAPVTAGIATLSVFFNTAGKHILTATYGGDACHTGSTSAQYSQVVNLNGSSTSLTSDVNPSDCGSKVNLTATVTPSTATGTVEFFNGATSLGTAPVAGGIATLSVTSLTIGKHMLTATYSGDGTYASSTSLPYSQTVNPVVTSTSLTSDVNPTPFENKVMLSATVTPNSSTGTVEFFDGATSIGTAPVTGGVATLSYFFPTEGKHVMTAVYSGDACHTGSTSLPYSQMVDQPTAVLLSLFEANTVADGVELRWQFSDASELASTWLERAPSLSGPWTRVDIMTEVQDGITVGIDRSVEANQTYNYRLVASLTGGGTVTFSPVDGHSGALVTEFALGKITPNPMKKAARIEYSLPKQAKVDVSIVDLQGRVVANLVSGVQAAGRYQTVWAGQGRSGRMPTGLYFVRYRTPDKVTTKRIVLQ